MFTTADGRNVAVTFALVSSLFLLWGFCNGMIDVMDKHFQEELHLSLAQSAWVQFAHYLGYFLMSLPAGWLAIKLGYKGGIVAGLLMVALGGFWFIPATKIAAFWAFLLGVCVIASGLTFLETVANPYTTVLGDKRYAATRINLAQSCNGVGWILGPIAGGMFFYGTDAAGKSTGAQTLWIPYAGVGVVVILLAVVFLFARMPDIKTEDEYHLDDNHAGTDAPAAPARTGSRALPYLLLLGNAAVLIGVFGMILWLALGTFGVGSRLVGVMAAFPRPAGVPLTPDSALLMALAGAGCVALVAAAIWLVPVTGRLAHRSIWAHEHFTGATLAQFFYVAAQAGIFSFLINYMTSEPPSLPASWLKPDSRWVEPRVALARGDFKDVAALSARLSAPTDPLATFLSQQLSPATVETMARFEQGTVDATAARVAMAQDLNSVILKQSIHAPERFAGVALQEKTQKLLAEDPATRNEGRLNRMLLADAYPGELGFRDGVVAISNQGAANLASFGFICFLIGRVTGAALLRRFSAHRVVGLYGALNVAMCLLVVCKLGWLSVAAVFLSYFFMSIMFPTIFALGIHGLGMRAKRASAYIVMAIMGGAILPKLMGYVADRADMSRGFLVPAACFLVVAAYGAGWMKLSGAAEPLVGTKPGRGH